MTIGFTNTFEGSATSSTGSSFAVTGTIANAGDPVACFVTCDSGNTVSNVTDTVGNTYTKKDDQADGTNLQRVTSWVGVGGSGTGSNTITATFNAASSFVGIQGAEVTGSSGYDTFATGQVQQTPTTGTDAVTTLTATPSVQPGGIIALSSNTSGAAAAAAGTGFTDNGAGWVNAGPSRLESKRYTSTSAIAGTFTAGSNVAHTTLALLFKEAGSGGATIGPGLKQVPGPGISPDKQATFAARKLSAFASPNVTTGITGNTATFTAGIITPALSVALSGSTATFTPGTVSVLSVATQGNTFPSGPGISPDYTKLFRPRQLSTFVTQGSDVTLGISGNTATFSSGTVLAAIDTALMGNTATFSAGTVMPTTPLTGNTATFSAGTLTPSITVTLTGATATFTPGTLTTTTALAITGVTATFSAGSVSPAIDIPLGGLTATFTAGTVTPQTTGDITAALTGITATFTAGTMQSSGGDIQGGSNPGGGVGGGFKAASDGWSGKFQFSKRKKLETSVPRETEIATQSTKIESESSNSSQDRVNTAPIKNDDEEAFELLLASYAIPEELLAKLLDATKIRLEPGRKSTR